jgi:hypothetical protein
MEARQRISITETKIQSNGDNKIILPISIRSTQSNENHHVPERSIGMGLSYFIASMLPLLVILVLVGCGGPAMEPAGTARETAQAFINAWEAEDASKLEAMLTSDFRQAYSLLAGGIASELALDRKYHSKPVPGSGRILKLEESGGTATATVAIEYDNKCEGCQNSAGDYVPEWASPGSYVYAYQLSLQKESNGKWLIGNLDRSSYYSDLREATHQAESDATTTAIVAASQSTQTAYALSAEQTRAAFPTDTPIPTQTPTSVPAFLTAKTAYEQGGIEAEMQKWSSDAILFRVFDRVNSSGWPFDYDPGYSGPYDRQDDLIDGAGRARHWLYFIAAPSLKEVKVLRVFDGQLDRQDVSAQMYRDLFAAQGYNPYPLDIESYIDSDEAVRLAREHGFSASNLKTMGVRLDAEAKHSWKAGYYEPSEPLEPGWVVGVGQSDPYSQFFVKMVVLDPETGEIVQNDF